MSQHIDLGDGVLEAQYTSKGPAKGMRWYTCQICGLDRSEDQVIVRDGAAFCTILNCSKDMNDRRR